MSAHLEYYVQHAQDDGWEPWDGPYETEEEALKALASCRERNQNQKYRAVVRLVTSWAPMEEEE